MSNKYLNLAWEYTAKNSGQKVVLLCLADHANDDGTCWPGVERIAEKTGIKERMVQNHLRDLENSGVIFVEKNKGMKTATGWTNRYTLTFKGCNAVPQGVQQSTPLNQQGVQCSTNKGCNAVPQGVQPTAPKPSVNPQSNHHLPDDDAPPAEKTLADFWTVYQTEIGGISSHISQLFGMYYDDGVAVEWMIDAVNIAAENNKRKASYVTGCLDKAIAAKVPPRLVFSTNGNNGNQPQQRTKQTVKDDFGNEMEVYV